MSEEPEPHRSTRGSDWGGVELISMPPGVRFEVRSTPIHVETLSWDSVVLRGLCLQGEHHGGSASAG